MASLAAAGTATALNMSKSEHITLFTSLLHSGKLAPHKCNAGATQRRGFGPTEDHYPQLSREMSPYSNADPFSLQELQDMSLHELSRARDYFGGRPVYWAPSDNDNGTVEANEQNPSLQLIRSLTDPDIIAQDAITSFPSETLDQMCMEANLALPEDTLHISHTTCTIISKDTLIPLQHSNEGTTATTVLAGSIIWIIWPPTTHNLDILQAAYEAFAPECNEATLEITSELTGGIVLTQIEGEGLRIPPYCPMIGLTLHTSVLATNSTTTIADFIYMLSKARLLKAWFRTEIDGKNKQTEFNKRLLKCFGLLLNGETNPEDPELSAAFKLPMAENGPLQDLLTVWEIIKDGLAELLGPADASVLADIWADFLIDAKGRECRICGVKISNKMRLMRGHFWEKHWVREDGKKRIDSPNFDDEVDVRGVGGLEGVVATTEDGGAS
ncbi:hypothetical protein T440DRAFT_540084 [Plenodomus tracheiphilus IPT5]|uniref:Uncharacterized protein n=1 Tax=Plenodomus tracheiphilus IPT5 TaxID=1408161 RepID=A0A6A7AYG6_9PLEO|nr:hypothetical protein T440DRAFT_540084 [Plenodomus tracheiphilus IPT5]